MNTYIYNNTLAIRHILALANGELSEQELAVWIKANMQKI